MFIASLIQPGRRFSASIGLFRGKAYKLFAISLFSVCSIGRAQTTCPPLDPALDFFSNFDNDCYALRFRAGFGDSTAGDTNARYELVYFKVDPRYELIVYSTFPNARYFGITVYDDHDAQLSTRNDVNFAPLTSSEINPFLPGTPFLAGQRYAAAINLGTPPVANETAGCSLSQYAVYLNQLAGSGRHAGMDWNGDPNLPPDFPPHKDVPSNAGSIMIRRYLEDPSENITAKLIVRDVGTGCAVPMQQVLNSVVTRTSKVYKYWKDAAQVRAHYTYSTKIQIPMCYALEPGNVLVWLRSPEYVPGINVDAAYLNAPVPARLISAITSPETTKFLRIRMRLPSTPNYPCAGCTLTGSEQLRYLSLSFLIDGTPLVSLSDDKFVRDPQGYVTLIVGAGAQPPSFVTAANLYTYLDLSQFRKYRSTNFISVRSILPAASFACQVNQIPYLTQEYDSTGGYMGEYAPMADIVDAASLSTTAEPLIRPDTCSLPQVPGTTQCSLLFPGFPLGALPEPLP
jgi:hypothetical protein